MVSKAIKARGKTIEQRLELLEEEVLKLKKDQAKSKDMLFVLNEVTALAEMVKELQKALPHVQFRRG